MINKKQFRYSWNDHIREGVLDQYRGAIGGAKVKANSMSTACNPEALQTPELEPNPENLEAVDEKGMAFYVNQLACQLIDGDVAGVKEYFNDAGGPANLVQLLENATGFAKTEILKFFSLEDIAGTPATVSENVPNPELTTPSREIIEKHFTQQLENLFNNIDYLHLRFILGNAMITYWRTLIEDDIMKLSTRAELANNARTIAEIEIDWLTKMLMSIKSQIKTKRDTPKTASLRTFFARTTDLNDEQVDKLAAAVEQDLGVINERRTPKEMPSTVAYIQSLPSNVQKSATQGVVNWLKRSKFALGRDSVAKLGAARSQLEPGDYEVAVPSWEPEVVKLAPALLKTISVEKFGQIYSRLLNKSPYAQTLIKAGKLSPWRAVEYEIQQAAAGDQATDHSGLAMMISRLGEKDSRYRSHFTDLLQREYPDFAFDPKLINRPDPEEVEKASQEKAAYVQNWADTLNQKLGTDKRKLAPRSTPGNNKLREQNQRWKYLAGIK
jgi:hypothetical protein